jgi:tRNA uridine 5-carboxymethylaminomethyl modification enzyme
MIDDIIHKKTPEPYRVLPSRAEYRLTLRFDNAFTRLLDKTIDIGILSKEKIEVLKESKETIDIELKRLKEIKIAMKEANELLEKLNSNQRFSKGINAYELLSIKEVSYLDLGNFTEILDIKEYVKNQIETIAKYETFIEREKVQIERFKKLEDIKLPKDINYDLIKGISNIARDGLKEVSPMTVGEATRISGVSGNDIALLIAYIR